MWTLIFLINSAFCPSSVWCVFPSVRKSTLRNAAAHTTEREDTLDFRRASRVLRDSKRRSASRHSTVRCSRASINCRRRCLRMGRASTKRREQQVKHRHRTLDRWHGMGAEQNPGCKSTAVATVTYLTCNPLEGFLLYHQKGLESGVVASTPSTIWPGMSRSVSPSLSLSICFVAPHPPLSVETAQEQRKTDAMSPEQCTLRKWNRRVGF
jgi:hypothetical protein